MWISLTPWRWLWADVSSVSPSSEQDLLRRKANAINIQFYLWIIIRYGLSYILGWYYNSRFLLKGIVRLTVEWFLRRENIRWLGWNTDYKRHSKDTNFRRKIKWRLEVWGALGIMGESVPLFSILSFHGTPSVAKLIQWHWINTEVKVQHQENGCDVTSGHLSGHLSGRLQEFDERTG